MATSKSKKRSTSKREKEKKVSAFLNRATAFVSRCFAVTQRKNTDWSFRKAEAISMMLLALSSFIFVALYTFEQDSQFAWREGWLPANAVGSVGQSLANGLLVLIGLMAYVVPAVLVVGVVLIWLHRKIGLSDRFSKRLERFTGFLLLLIAGSACFDIVDLNDNRLANGSGGVLGRLVGDWLLSHFHYLGSYLFIALGLQFSVVLMLNDSFTGILFRIGKGVRWLSQSFVKAGVVLWRFIKNKILPKLVACVTWFDHHKNDEKIIKEAPNLDLSKALPGLVSARDKDTIEEASFVPIEINDTTPVSEKSVSKTSKSKLLKKPKKTKKSTIVKEGLPTLELLDEAAKNAGNNGSPVYLQSMSQLLHDKLCEFGVKVDVVGAYPGPVVTRFEVNPEAGVKASKISGLAKDLARSLSVMAVRVVEVIPGKPFVGIEIPNQEREMVNFQEVLSSEVFSLAKSPLTLALGHDISGEPVVADLAKMPHLLVAGTTGSGKSVGVNAMLLSLLYKATPDELRLLLVDPKMLELSVYEGIPHLIAPVVTDMKDASNGLRWCVVEMERRYKLMSKVGVRNMAGFNDKVRQAIADDSPLKDPLWQPAEGLESHESQSAPDLEPLPSIVVVVDEFADMIMVVGKKVEELIARIAQKARAAGIHLILATQRPSVDVITGLIKANVPTRIGFQVSSKIDSRTILDQGGAEQLLGNGDMLYLPPGTAAPMRVHGAFVSDDEVHRVAEDWKKRGQPQYIEGVLEEQSSIPGLPDMGGDDDEKELLAAAIEHVMETKKCSISALQRKLKIGYNRSAAFVEEMQKMGIVGEPNGNGVREVIRK